MNVLKLVLLIVAIFLSISTIGGFMISMGTGGFRYETFIEDKEDLMSRYDFNGDGLLSFEEFKAVNIDARHGNSSEKILQSIKSEFRVEDTDNDGFLDDFEFSDLDTVWFNDLYNIM